LTICDVRIGIRWSGKARNAYKIVVEDWKSSGHVVDKDVVMKNIRKLGLDRRDVIVWSEWSWLMIGPSGGHFIHDNEISGSQRCAYF
jgi:hypothetical protein